MSIDREIEEMASQLADNTQENTSPSLEDMILEMGSEGLKKALPSLTPTQVSLLKSTLSEMVAKGAKGLDAVVATTIEGEMEWNITKPEQSQQDEIIADEAEKENLQVMRNQGGVPIEGWEGQVIGEGEAPVSMEDPSDIKVPEMMKSEAEVKEEKNEEPKEENKMSKENAKKNFVSLVKRMQERKLEKSQCVKVLVKSTGASEALVEAAWEEIAKSYAEAKMDLNAKVVMKEKDRTEVPPQLEKEVSLSKEVADPAVPAPKTDIECDDAEVEERMKGGESDQLADEGEAVPKTLKKSEDFWHVEDEVYNAPKEDVFKSNTYGKNTHFSVDAFIEAEESALAENLSKSTFLYPEKAELSKSRAQDYIEAGLDMDGSSLEVAEKNKNAKEQGGFLVKSFADSDMDAFFKSQDMWAETSSEDENGLGKSDQDDLEKGRKPAAIGTKSPDGKREKTARGWVPVKGSGNASKKEESKSVLTGDPAKAHASEDATDVGNGWKLHENKFMGPAITHEEHGFHLLPSFGGTEVAQRVKAGDLKGAAEHRIRAVEATKKNAQPKQKQEQKQEEKLGSLAEKQNGVEYGTKKHRDISDRMSNAASKLADHHLKGSDVSEDQKKALARAFILHSGKKEVIKEISDKLEEHKDSSSPHIVVEGRVVPNYRAKATGKIGSGKPETFQDDPLAWFDTKFGATKKLIEEHKKQGKSLEIHTSSDLAGHDDYMENLPKNSVINLHNQGGEPAMPSEKRLRAAGAKLEAAGHKVNYHGFSDNVEKPAQSKK